MNSRKELRRNCSPIGHNNTKHFLCPIRSRHPLEFLEIVRWESVPRGSFARIWKLSSHLFFRPDWLSLGLRGWVNIGYRTPTFFRLLPRVYWQWKMSLEHVPGAKPLVCICLYNFFKFVRKLWRRNVPLDNFKPKFGAFLYGILQQFCISTVESSRDLFFPPFCPKEIFFPGESFYSLAHST